MSGEDERKVVVHLDVDAFYVACERELRPELQNRPLAVSQYNPYGDLRDIAVDDSSRILYDGAKRTAEQQQPSNPNSNGSLIAVSYEARARNVGRNDRGYDAVAKCPELCIIQVPVQNGKANLTIYRDASERVMTELTECMKAAAVEIFQDLHNLDVNSAKKSGTDSNNDTEDNLVKRMHQIKVEKASVDEIYIDLSVPVQTIVKACRQGRGGNNLRWQRLHFILTKNGSTSTHTTIGGLETSEAAIAANSLSKNDIRKGSSLQMLDSNDIKDVSRKAWWSRRFPQAWDPEEISLAVGSLVTLKARQGVLEKFKGVYTLSAGVSSNKVMAKLASGLKKPNRQTLINPSDESTLQNLFHPLPLGRIRGLGGRFGDEVEEILQVKTVGDLAKVPLATLQSKFGDKNATFLFRIAQGICDEEVTERTKAKSIGAGKTFRGILAIHSTDQATLKKWIAGLLSEIMDRVDSDNTRYPKTLIVGLSMQLPGENGVTKRDASQSAPLPRNATMQKRLEIAFGLAKAVLSNAAATCPSSTVDSVMVVGISVSAGNFESIATGSNSILNAFQRGASSSASTQAAQVKKPTPLLNMQRAAKRPRTGTLTSFLVPQPTIRAMDDWKDMVVTPNGCDVDSSAGETTRGPTFSSQHAAPQRDEDLGGCSDPDLEYAREIQAQLNGDANPDRTSPTSRANKRSKKSHGDTIDSTTSALGNPDLRYALQLQASFDRENEVLSSLDHKHSKTSETHVTKPLRNHKKRASSSKMMGERSGSSTISKFFSKK